MLKTEGCLKLMRPAHQMLKAEGFQNLMRPAHQMLKAEEFQNLMRPVHQMLKAEEFQNSMRPVHQKLKARVLDIALQHLDLVLVCTLQPQLSVEVCDNKRNIRHSSFMAQMTTK